MNSAALIRAAEHFAREAHRDQQRKFYGAPYIVHPARVAEKAARRNFPPHAVAAAWAHDCLEDCDVTYDLLADATDDSVAMLVRCLTNPSKRHPDWPRREKKALDVAWIAEQSTLVRRLKMIDRIDNLQDMITHIDTTPVEVLRRYVEETKALHEWAFAPPNPVMGVFIGGGGMFGCIHSPDGTDPRLERELEAVLASAVRHLRLREEIPGKPLVEISSELPGNSPRAVPGVVEKSTPPRQETLLQRKSL